MGNNTESTSKVLKGGIIGLGKMGILHSAIVNSSEHSQLSAISEKKDLTGKVFSSFNPNISLYNDYEKMISNIQEVKARKGKIITIATEGDDSVKEFSDDIIYIPDVPEDLSPIVVAIPLQLLAYHIAVLLKCNVDQPRNLAKSVTVE